MTIFDFLNRAPVRRWLEHAANVSFGSGWQLVEALGTPAPAGRYAGLGDNCAVADDCLTSAEKAGLLVRGAYEPSRSQVFFGSIQGPGRDKRPAEYGWIVPPAGEIEIRRRLAQIDARTGKPIVALGTRPPGC